MLFKVKVGLTAENGKFSVTLPNLEFNLEKILPYVEIFTVNKNICLFPGLCNLNTYGFIKEEETIDFGIKATEFLRIAGAHSTILNTVQQGIATVNEVNILEVYNSD